MQESTRPDPLRSGQLELRAFSQSDSTWESYWCVLSRRGLAYCQASGGSMVQRGELLLEQMVSMHTEIAGEANCLVLTLNSTAGKARYGLKAAAEAELQLWRMALLVGLVAKGGEAGRPSEELPEVGSESYQKLQLRLEQTSNRLLAQQEETEIVHTQQQADMGCQVESMHKELLDAQAQVRERDAQYTSLKASLDEIRAARESAPGFKSMCALHQHTQDAAQSLLDSVVQRKDAEIATLHNQLQSNSEQHSQALLLLQGECRQRTSELVPRAVGCLPSRCRNGIWKAIGYSLRRKRQSSYEH